MSIECADRLHVFNLAIRLRANVDTRELLKNCTMLSFHDLDKSRLKRIETNTSFNGVARIYYYVGGGIKSIYFTQEYAMMHNIPKYCRFHANGNPAMVTWQDSSGFFHREEGEAYMIWSKEGKYTRSSYWISGKKLGKRATKKLVDKIILTNEIESQLG